MSAGVQTPWGYAVDAAMEPILSPADFEQMTGGRWSADDPAVVQALAAASQAVRAYCGWHVCPSMACTVETQGPGRCIELPTMALVEVTEVTESGEVVEADAYMWRGNGLLARKWGCWPAEWRSVTVDFVSGFAASAVPDLAAVVVQLASNAIAAAPGVQREQAGNVSISYNATANGVSGGISLLGRDRALLAPYRLPAIPR